MKEHNEESHVKNELENKIKTQYEEQQSWKIRSIKEKAKDILVEYLSRRIHEPNYKFIYYSDTCKNFSLLQSQNNHFTSEDAFIFKKDHYFLEIANQAFQSKNSIHANDFLATCQIIDALDTSNLDETINKLTAQINRLKIADKPMDYSMGYINAASKIQACLIDEKTEKSKFIHQKMADLILDVKNDLIKINPEEINARIESYEKENARLENKIKQYNTLKSQIETCIDLLTDLEKPSLAIIHKRLKQSYENAYHDGYDVFEYYPSQEEHDREWTERINKHRISACENLTKLRRNIASHHSLFEKDDICEYIKILLDNGNHDSLKKIEALNNLNLIISNNIALIKTSQNHLKITSNLNQLQNESMLIKHCSNIISNQETTPVKINFDQIFHIIWKILLDNEINQIQRTAFFNKKLDAILNKSFIQKRFLLKEASKNLCVELPSETVNYISALMTFR